MKIVKVTVEVGDKLLVLGYDEIQQLQSILKPIEAKPQASKVVLTKKREQVFVPQEQVELRRSVLDLLPIVWPSLNKGQRSVALSNACGVSSSRIRTLINPTPRPVGESVVAALSKWVSEEKNNRGI